MKKRDVGEMGEKTLEHWCAEVGIVANRASRDRSGWDYLIEFSLDLPSRASVPLDRVGGPIQCLVQVKSTDGSRGSLALKLDNAWRFVHAPMPAFVLILQFSNRSTVQAAYLIHFDEQVLRRVLTVVRGLSTKQRTIQLHKHSLRIAWGEEEKLSSANAEDFLAALRTAVTPSFAEYVRKKEKVLREAGYEGGGEVVETSVILPVPAPGESIDDVIADFALGKNGPLRIAPGAKVWDERFGIRYPTPLQIIPTEGRLRSGPIGQGRVRMQSHDGQQEVLLEVDIYSTGPLTAFLSDRTLRVRLSNQDADFSFRGDAFTDWRVTLHVPGKSARVSIEAMFRFARLVGVLGSANVQSPLRAAFDLQGFQFEAELPTAVPIDDALRDLANLGHWVFRLARHFRFPTHLKVIPGVLWNQKAKLELMDAALRSDTLNAKVEYATEGEPLPDRPLCIPSFLHVWIGDSVGVLAIAYMGAPSRPVRVEEGYDVRELKIDAVVVAESASGSKEALPPPPIGMLDRIAAKYEPTHTVVRWWDEAPPSELIDGSRA